MAVRNLVGLTVLIRVANPGGRGTREERETRVFLPDWIKEGGGEVVHVDLVSVTVFRVIEVACPPQEDRCWLAL